MIEETLYEWQEYDARIGEDSPAVPILPTSRESHDSHEGPFLLGGAREAATETETMLGHPEASEAQETGWQVAPVSEAPAQTESFEYIDSRRPLTAAPSEAARPPDALEIDPYAGIRSALAPEHANLGENEINFVLGRMPATLVLHQMIHSPEMRQATLATSWQGCTPHGALTRYRYFHPGVLAAHRPAEPRSGAAK